MIDDYTSNGEAWKSIHHAIFSIDALTRSIDVAIYG
jgi:hypothetical protein